METNEVKAYVPFRPVHPFDILKEELDARGISQKEFAEMIDMKASNFSRMLKAKGELSSETAFKLEKALGIPYSFWMGFQEKYLRDRMNIEKREQRENSARQIWEYLKTQVYLPLLKKEGIIADVPVEENVKSVFRFFSVGSLDEFVRLKAEHSNALCRKSGTLTTDENALFTWKYLCINKSREIQMNSKFDKSRVDEIRDDVNRALYADTDVVKNVGEALASHGIKFVIAKKYGQVPVDGLSFWDGENPTIAVSLRHDRIDIFAFTVFHELGHIIRHLSKDKGDAINPNDERNSRLEKEADNFAQQSLIFPDVWRRFVQGLKNQLFRNLENYIMKFAQDEGIHPRILFGRYCHETSDFRRKVNIPYRLS